MSNKKNKKRKNKAPSASMDSLSMVDLEEAVPSNVLRFPTSKQLNSKSSGEEMTAKLGFFQDPHPSEMSTQMISKNALILLGVLVISWVGNQVMMDLGTSSNPFQTKTFNGRGIASVKSVSSEDLVWQENLTKNVLSKGSLSFMGRSLNQEEKLKFETLNGNYKFTYSTKGGVSRIDYFYSQNLAPANGKNQPQIDPLNAQRLPYYIVDPISFIQKNKAIWSADFGRADLILDNSNSQTSQKIYNLFKKNQVSARVEMTFDSFKRLISMKFLDAAAESTKIKTNSKF